MRGTAPRRGVALRAAVSVPDATSTLDRQRLGRFRWFRRLLGRGRGRWVLLAALLAGLVALGVALPGSDSGHSGFPAVPTSALPAAESDAWPPTTTTTSAPSSSTVELDALDVEIRSVQTRSPGGALEQLGKQVRKRITATIAGYVTEASLRPLQVRDGTVREQRLRSLFTEPIRSRLAGPDRATLVDEGMDRAVGGVDVERAAVELSVLGDAEGTPRLVTATLDLAVVAHSADGPLLITRTGDLVLSPHEQRWLIDGYRLSVTRDLGADATARAGV